jgi:tetratricopeptide (TPR) repeat protein
MPEEIDSLVARAGNELRAGQVARATDTIEQALREAPRHRRANLIASMLEVKRGRADLAIRRLEELLEINANDFELLVQVSIVFRLSGDLAKSLHYAKLARGLRPLDGHVHSNLGLTLIELRDLTKAAEAFEEAIRLSPKVAQNYEQLAKISQLQGRDRKALELYRCLHRLIPGSAESLVAHAQAAANLNLLEESMALAGRTLRQDSENGPAKLIMAGALIELGRVKEAEPFIDAIESEGQPSATTLSLLGMRWQALGRMAEANEAYRNSIRQQPNQGISYCSLIRNIKVSESDREMLNSMEDLIRQDSLNPRGQSFLHFGLGKAYDDLGEYGNAIGHFDRANEIAYRLKFGSGSFEQERLSAYVDWSIETFSESFIRGESPSHPPSPSPIFIVGMMRSGTTLAEQILSSHPDVEGAGERTFWLNHWPEAIRPGGRAINRSRLEELSREYVQELKSLFPEAERVTDKMPGNYRVLGVIAAAFPNAKFIHTQRDPIDTCLSIYMTPNRVPTDFANNRRNIVFAYRQYERLMAHWQRVLGPERLLSVQYESLVTTPEPETRRILRFLETPWDDRCLKPEENIRPVITPSVWQVRQPVYTSSVHRWKRYEPWLGEFAELKSSLGPVK